MSEEQPEKRQGRGIGAALVAVILLAFALAMLAVAPLMNPRIEVGDYTLYSHHASNAGSLDAQGFTLTRNRNGDFLILRRGDQHYIWALDTGRTRY